MKTLASLKILKVVHCEFTDAGLKALYVMHFLKSPSGGGGGRATHFPSKT